MSVAAGCAAPAPPLPSPTTPRPTSSVAPATPTAPSSTPVAGEVGLAMSDVARAAADPKDARLAAAAVNDFGLELLRLGTDPHANAVISPSSIMLALGMQRLGARGTTAVEMDEVMRGAGADGHAGWLNAFDATLANRSGTFVDAENRPKEVALDIANAPFAQRDFEWRQQFLDDLASRFGAGIRLVDYIDDTESARLTINKWVAGATEDRIPDLISEGVLTPSTRLALVNAIYLKAAWLQPFPLVNSGPRDFQLLDGSTIKVATMHRELHLRFATGDGWIAAELPYVGEKLAMTILVPEDLLAFQEALDGAAFAAIVDRLEDSYAVFTMPKFGVETKADLVRTLSTMGMPAAFDPGRADFTGMTVARLSLTAVVHQANLDLDEYGTEAAAATASISGFTALPPIITIARPFLFALRDRPTGAILFLGRVVEPIVTSP
jgi:serpin B